MRIRQQGLIQLWEILSSYIHGRPTLTVPAERVMTTLWLSTPPSSTGEGGLSEQEAAATQDTTVEVSIHTD